MKNVKYKKQLDEQKRLKNILSANIGITASITLAITIIKDVIVLFITTDTKWLNFIFGILILALFLLVLKVDFVSKIKNKPNLHDMVDVFTMVSIIVFGLENAAISFIDNTYEKILLLVVLIALLGLCIWAFVWTFFYKKDRNHYVD